MQNKSKLTEALNVEEALTQSEAFLINNKKRIISAVAAVIIVVAGIVMYKNLYVEPREEKRRLHCSKDRNTLKQIFTSKH